MIYASQAIADQDSRRLYRVIDERARHALISIATDRHRTAEIIRQDYPSAEQQEALAQLGPEAEDGESLFVLRCDAPCRQQIGDRIGGIQSQREEGVELVVTTSRDTDLRFYRPEEGHWWGIVWNTHELDRERARANRDLHRVERNAGIYARRRQLDGDPAAARP